MGYEGNLTKWNLKNSPTPKVVNGTTITEVTFDARSKLNLFKKSFIVYNAGPGTLANAVVEASPDEVFWGTIDGTSFANLGSASMMRAYYESSDKYIRFRATGSLDVTGGTGTMVYATLSAWWQL